MKRDLSDRHNHPLQRAQHADKEQVPSIKRDLYILVKNDLYMYVTEKGKKIYQHNATHSLSAPRRRAMVVACSTY